MPRRKMRVIFQTGSSPAQEEKESVQYVGSGRVWVIYQAQLQKPLGRCWLTLLLRSRISFTDFMDSIIEFSVNQHDNYSPLSRF